MADEILLNDETEELPEVELTEEEFQIVDGVLTRYDGSSIEVVVPEGVKTIGNGVSMTFIKSGVERVVLPEGVNSIGGYAFCNCRTLESINIPEGVTSIGSRAFSGCFFIEELTIPASVTEIGDKAFEHCDSLVIHGVSGSYAEKYAVANKIQFESIGLGTAPAEEEGEDEEDPVPKFTYEKGTKAGGKGYSILLPDGFVVKRKLEDRDFIAYYQDPDGKKIKDYFRAPILVLAGNQLRNEAFAGFGTPIEYIYAGYGICAVRNVSYGDNRMVKCERTDLPGVIVFGYNPGRIEANAYFGVDGGLQGITIVLNGVTTETQEGYEALVEELFSHMQAAVPVKYIREIDDEEFRQMAPSGETFDSWLKLLDEYMGHITMARSIAQNGLAREFDILQKSDRGEVGKFKSSLRSMLQDMSNCAGVLVRKANEIYRLKCQEYPENENLELMKEAVEKLGEFSVQELELDGKMISTRSRDAAEVLNEIYNEKKKKYDAACIEIDAQRSGMISMMLEKKRHEIIDEAEKNKAMEIRRLKEQISDLEKKKKEAESNLETLGLFKSKEKKECNEHIEWCRVDIENATEAIRKTEETCEEIIAQSMEKARENLAEYTREAAERFPYPEM